MREIGQLEETPCPTWAFSRVRLSLARIVPGGAIGMPARSGDAGPLRNDGDPSRLAIVAEIPVDERAFLTRRAHRHARRTQYETLGEHLHRVGRRQLLTEVRIRVPAVFAERPVGADAKVALRHYSDSN